MSLAQRIRKGLPFGLTARWQARHMKKFNLRRGLVVLSFDNDYQQDNEATPELASLLNKFGFKASWAVIGLWVERHMDLHRRLIDEGHELVNHTWSHPDQKDLRPQDSRKFDQISAAEVEQEIVQLHKFCLEKLNYQMTGFRLPHFRPHPAAATVLKRLSYQYTSSVSSFEFANGSVPTTIDGLLELPLATIPRRVDRMPETYRLFRSPNGLYHSEEQFFRDFCELLGFTEKFQLFTCLYFDPADVKQMSKPTFTSYLEALKSFNVDVITLREAAGKFSNGQ